MRLQKKLFIGRPTLLLVTLLCVGNTAGAAADVASDHSPLILIAETALLGVPPEDGGNEGNPAPPRQITPKKALDHWNAVDAGVLDDMRGGFDTSLQLKLSFGIERAVYLNGALVTTTTFNLPDVGSTRREDPTSLSVASGSVSLLQNGPGNSFALSPTASPLAATVIQNTLNNQSIQGVTTINASVNSLEMLRATGLQSLIRDGLSNAIVPR